MKILIKEKLSEHKSKTPEGYLICEDAILARTGPQEYYYSELFPEKYIEEDKLISVDRTPEEVFAPQALASFENKPLTCEHPDENVTPENYKDLSVGFVRDVRKGTYNGQDVMMGNLVITDAQIIDDIENNIRTELSCGYDCDITEDDHPRQINIRGNHIALCEQGRAGIAKILDSGIKVKEVNGGYVLVRTDNWKKFGMNTNVERICENEDQAKAEKESLEKHDGIQFTIINREKDVLTPKQIIEREFNPERIYSVGNNYIIQFTSKVDADSIVKNAKLNPYIIGMDEDESAYFVTVSPEIAKYISIDDTKINDDIKLNKYTISFIDKLGTYRHVTIEAVDETEAGLKLEHMYKDRIKKVTSIDVMDSINHNKLIDTYGKSIFHYIDRYMTEESNHDIITDSKNNYSNLINNENNWDNFISWYLVAKVKDSRHSEMYQKNIDELINHQKNLDIEKEEAKGTELEEEIDEAVDNINKEINKKIRKLKVRKRFAPYNE